MSEKILSVNRYSTPASQPSVSSILEKYRVPWRHEAEPSFVGGIASALDFFGDFGHKVGFSSFRFRRNSQGRKSVKLLSKDDDAADD